MKRYLVVAAIFGVTALLFWSRHGGNTSAPDTSESLPPALATKKGSAPVESANLGEERTTTDHGSNAPAEGHDDDLQEALPYYKESPDVPVALYGLVVDQDTNALRDVKVDVEIIQWDLSSSRPTLKTVQMERQAGADGRFEVGGLNGHSVTIRGFTKEGYEPELVRRDYGEYGPHGGSTDQPIVFYMWRTNLHEPLISGEKSFVVIPDGRHYAMDLTQGTIAEGDVGDLVAWIKRPEGVKWGQRYDWSCELAVPAGGLLADSHYAMFTAPESGYTNAFAYQAEANSRWWGFLTGDKRFYVRLRSGQMYGRIVVNLYADYGGKEPGLIRMSYAVNPSGSRLLR